LNNFIADPDVKDIYEETMNTFPDLIGINSSLTKALNRYKYYFNKEVPQVVTFISAFNYTIVSLKNHLGIGLEMYLGSDCKYYPSLSYPQYKIRKMSREYIVADAMKGWAQSEWEFNDSISDFLSQMLYAGKMTYFLNMLMPDAPDSIKTGYSQEQLKWSEDNEKKTWSFFVDHRLIYSTDQNQIAKYINDGPSTSGFPKESPGGIAQWIGYNIINSYMNENPDVTLPQLMDDQDYKKILNQSKYKPRR
jgi:hypothetical protein